MGGLIFVEVLVICSSLWTAVCGQANVVRYNQDDIQEIVGTHNDLRRYIKDAANMRELVSCIDISTILYLELLPRFIQHLTFFLGRFFRPPFLSIYIFIFFPRNCFIVVLNTVW